MEKEFGVWIAGLKFRGSEGGILAEGHPGDGRGEGVKMSQDSGVLGEMTFQLWQDTEDARDVAGGRLAELG